MRPPARAAVLVEPGRFEVRPLPLPEPGAGELLVRLEGCGLCASSLPLFEGRDWFDYPQPPGAPGHEGWGRIERLGEGVTGLKVGQRVALLSDRALATHDIAAASQVVPLPPALDAMHFPGEPLGCAMNIFARSEVQPGQTVAVIGIGFLGALLVRLATQAGARVIALSRRRSSLALAEAMGADALIPLDERWRVVEQVEALTGGQLCERTIEATGKQEPLDLAAELTGTRGRLVIAGYHQDGLRTVNMQLWNWRGLDVINAHERAPERYVEGMRAAVAAVAEGRLDPTPLYSHRYPLAEVERGMRDLAAYPEGFVKGLVEIA